jgi:trans-2,3-dihydro-3-hydroxyanthranilate isomerase
MQALAREMNLSETTFVFPSAAATRHVRFFTPAAEIPLAGHPTIGTWWALAELGLLGGLPTSGVHRVTQETGRGILPVDIELRDGRPTSVEMTQAPPEWGAVHDRAPRPAPGGGPDLWPTGPPQVSTALPQPYPVRGRGARRRPVAGWEANSRFCCAPGDDRAMPTPRRDRRRVGAPMFAPGLGVAEDPATGSAAGALGAYLVRHGVAAPAQGEVRLTLEQGVEIGRPSRIAVRVRCGRSGDISEVRVGGAAVRVITGDVTL